MAHGWSQGPIGAVVAAWPAVSLVGTFELVQMAADWTAPAQADGSPEDGTDDINAAAYRTSVETGRPLSERKLAEMFGKTSRLGPATAWPRPAKPSSRGWADWRKGSVPPGGTATAFRPRGTPAPTAGRVGSRIHRVSPGRRPQANAV